jgi:amino acid adenylation domain-containing protein
VVFGQFSATIADRIALVKEDSAMASSNVTSGATNTASPASIALRDAAAARPDDAALEIGELRVSFGELNAQADRLAQWLVEGSGDGDRIAVRANGTHASTVAFMAITRAGRVSVPIDPTAPQARVREILTDVDAALLLTDVGGDESRGVPGGHPLALAGDRAPSPIDRQRGELVSIVYTSGSTGAPKGIMVSREQMDQTYVADARKEPGARLGVIFAGTNGNIERQISAALHRQGTLVSYEIREHGIAPLAAWLQRERIVTISMVPTILRHLLSILPPQQRLDDLRTVVLSGETCTWGDITRLRAHLSPEATIINAFGLTEAAGIAALHITADVPAGEGPVPAGELSATARVTIVGEDGADVPAGQSGEIVVEGPDCALGYWRRPQLTRSVFTEMPSGHRQVRTGDGGRIRDDGLLEHLGRLDHVVKISGNRVELGEVESGLAKLDGVAAAAAATYVDDTGSTRLTAAVVARRGAALDARVMRALLARRLPGHMLPDQIVVVEELPQLPGGKLDRAGVAALAKTEPGSLAPRPAGASALEEVLSAIWCDVLGLRAVANDEDFFALGGDSMRAARVFVELERRHGIDRPVSLLLEAPTIATLALALADTADWTALLPVATAGSRPPLFVIHDGAGSVAYSRSLAGELGPQQPIYGVRCEGLNGEPLRAESLEELAATYVERVRAIRRLGPYLFYGVSAGGVIAMEMARQLVNAGEQVPLVALGDSWVPTGPRSSALGLLSARLGELRRMSGWSRLRHLGLLVRRQLAYRAGRLRPQARAERQQQRMANRALERGERVPPAARSAALLQEFRGLVDEYRPRPPFADRVVLLRAEGALDRPDRGWSGLVAGALEVIDVPGRHLDLGREASGSYVGPVLARLLDERPH